MIAPIPVTPAKAGVQETSDISSALDSRFRGKDGLYRDRAMTSRVVAPILVLALAAASLASPARGATLPDPDHLYTTWDGPLEVDKAATIWLIKRHLDPLGGFRFLPRGTRIQEGTSFEVPFASLERAPNRSLFETLLAAHVPEPSPALVALGRLVHDAEINLWAEKQVPETRGIDSVVQGLVADGPPAAELVSRILVVFDGLHATLKEKLE